MQPRLQQSEYITYDADGRRTERWSSTRIGSRFSTRSCRRYVGPFTFNTDTLERVDFPGGYFDGLGKAHFLLTDWQGNVDMVVGSDGMIKQHNTYYPYGEPHREPSGQRRLFAGKERQDYVASGTSDFGPRRYFSSLPLWGAGDKNAAAYAYISPYVFCGANPIKNKEVDGNWYIRVSTSEDRGQYPYGVLTLYSTNDEPLYKTVVMAKGANGRIRNIKNSDTPQGIYNILGWHETNNARYDVLRYGGNPLLRMDYLPNQEGGTRNAMHLHGGRAAAVKEGRLSITNGCIRICDEDIAEIKAITDFIEANNPFEFPEQTYVYDDLEEPVWFKDRDEIKNTFMISLPELIISTKILDR